MPELPQSPAPHPAPLPIQLLPYSVPLHRGRPRLLTAIGVTSIVVGSLTIVVNLLTACWFVGSGIVTLARAGLAAPSPAPRVASTSAPTTGSTGPTSAEVQKVIQRVQAQTSLTVAQVTALRTALEDTSVPLVIADYMYAPVASATTDKNGVATISFNGGGYIFLFPDGRVLARGAVGSNVTPPYADKLMRAEYLSNGLAALISLSFAVVLISAGIALLRGSMKAIRMHRFFAYGKIMTALLASVADGWFMIRLSTTRGSGMDAMDFLAGVLMGGSVAGLIYPLVLLIFLRSWTVRRNCLPSGVILPAVRRGRAR